MEITLPSAKLPEPILEELKLANYKSILVVDDDESIHAAWSKRLSYCGITLHHVGHENGLRNWMADTCLSESLILIDYDLGKDCSSGTEIIAKYGLHRNAIVVTNHHDNVTVNGFCIEHSVPLIPKQLVPIVPVVFH